MEKLKIGIIGAGLIAAMKHVPAIQGNERVILKAVCRRNKDRLSIAHEAFGSEEAYTDWREMIQKAALDAVIICTPHDLHAEPTIESLRHRLHVLLEKPMANTGIETRAILKAENESNRVLMVAYNHRFRGNWRTAKESIENGEIGEIRQLNLAFTIYRHFFWEEKLTPEPIQKMLLDRTGMPDSFFDWDLTSDWKSSPDRTGGGTFNNAGAHWANLALWLAGSPAAEVSAITRHDKQDVEYFISAIALLKNGVQLAITFADAIPGKEHVRLTVIGDNGIITYDHTDGEIRKVLGGAVESIRPKYEDTDPVGCFADCVLDGSANLSPGKDAANTVYLTEAIYRSSKENRTCTI